MKNEVRPIDANATVEALRANFQQGSWYGCEEPCYQIAEDTIAEMPTLTAHFPDLTKMIPLTLDQLREMDGQPVWVEAGNQFSDWGKVDLKRGRIWPFGTAEEWWDFRHYGDWVPYAYPPAHIDREAWTSEWIYPENKWNLPICSKCGCNSQDATYGHKDNFCPRCGRAMKPEAWAELEKRMGVKG